MMRMKKWHIFMKKYRKKEGEKKIKEEKEIPSCFAHRSIYAKVREGLGVG